MTASVRAITTPWVDGSMPAETLDAEAAADAVADAAVAVELPV